MSPSLAGQLSRPPAPQLTHHLLREVGFPDHCVWVVAPYLFIVLQDTLPSTYQVLVYGPSPFFTMGAGSMSAWLTLRPRHLVNATSTA